MEMILWLSGISSLVFFLLAYWLKIHWLSSDRIRLLSLQGLKMLFPSYLSVLFRLAIVMLGFWLTLTGYTLVKSANDFVGGFLLVVGIQIFCWAIGIRLHVLGNVIDDRFQNREIPEVETGGVSSVAQH
ncbi:MAG: hypothetical protein ACRD82_19470 [Blastocatellia bacterium]